MCYSNLHTHTVFSDGAHTLRENVESAIEKNMLSLGFSDHSFTSSDTSYCIKKEAYPDYFKAVNELKEEYKDIIPVYLGLEMDYFSEIEREKFDYIIGSVHYIIKDGICYPIDHSATQQYNCINDAFGGSVLDMAKHYYESVVEHARLNKPDVIGHFDVITKFSVMPEDDEEYKKFSLYALEETLKYCKYIEVNTGAMSRKVKDSPYPNKFLLENILKLGGEVVLGSDSHNKNNLVYAFDSSVEMLKNIGFDHISVFNGRTFEKQDI